ncbi:hypothetical protein JCGZ_16199 [Jatropha curcas]|uniref:Uncharacterized protein n=1 Tax=Jatropha curcas TaxID=180498 RepID=A0A067KFM1_JATCU|nr:hypothetical protein JCGZ_16199 [Jatropha curcas]
MDSDKFEEYSSLVDLVYSGALSATGKSHANGFFKRQRVSHYPGLPSNGGSATDEAVENYGANGGGGAVAGRDGEGSGGGGEGGGGGEALGGGGGGALRIPILLRTPRNELQQLYEIDLYSDMNREQVLDLLHHHWCLYANQPPRQNVTRETVWPGFRVIFCGLLDIYDPYPDEEDFVELDFNGDWFQFHYRIERIIVERLAR